MMGTWLPETCWATIRREIKNTKSDIQSGFLIHTVVQIPLTVHLSNFSTRVHLPNNLPGHCDRVPSPATGHTECHGLPTHTSLWRINTPWERNKFQADTLTNSRWQTDRRSIHAQVYHSNDAAKYLTIRSRERGFIAAGHVWTLNHTTSIPWSGMTKEGSLWGYFVLGIGVKEELDWLWSTWKKKLPGRVLWLLKAYSAALCVHCTTHALISVLQQLR